MTDKLLRIVKQLEANRQLAFEARMAAIRADDVISEIGREAYDVLQEIARACHCDEADLGAAKYRRETCPVHGRPEAPATSCRGCNHERHPSLACGECERAGHVCTGLATHRSVRTAPAAQAGLPAAEVAVTTEHLAMWAAGRFGWGHDTYMNSLLRECCEDDIRANTDRLLARVADYERLHQADKERIAYLEHEAAEHDREREADRRRIEELEKRMKTERAMKEGCQKHLRDVAEALSVAGISVEDDEPTSQRAMRAIADLRRQHGEAQAEVADLLPRLDAAALENTQLCRERDGARNELAAAKRERADYGDKMTARTGELENELATLRAWKEGAMAVMAEWDGLRKLVEDGSPAQLGRGLAENTERVIRDLRAKVDELESGARVARLVEANRKLKAKVERRTWLVEQALEGRRSNWTLSQWFDWEHTALAELATDAQ